jgi:hypothetical protein
VAHAAPARVHVASPAPARANASPANARASAPPANARASATAGTHLQVSEVEYRLMLSEAVVKAGPVDLETIDAGMDPHDLRLRRGRGPVLYGTQPLAPGQILDAVVDMRPGTYHLWCSLPGHWKLGMHATLRVVR